jgi:hypothetical protein
MTGVNAPKDFHQLHLTLALLLMALNVGTIFRSLRPATFMKDWPASEMNAPA